jgi:uncharacterized protein Veg
MDRLTNIKRAIEKLYQTNPNVHISVDIPRPRLIVERTSAVITGVYRNFFQIEEYDKGRPTRHTIQYGDVLIGHVVIEELT